MPEICKFFPWFVPPEEDRVAFLLGTLDKTALPVLRTAVSSLDEESKWTVHYTAPWHQQENVFLPGSRPACVEDLHRQAKVNLKTVLRECDKLRKDGIRSSQYYSQGPAFSAASLYDGSLSDHGDTDKKVGLSSVDEERLVYSTPLHRVPQPENGQVRRSQTNGKTNWSKTLPLPTPEEKMRQQAQCVHADIIPIDVTGNGEFQSHSMYIPGQCSTLGRVGSVSSTSHCSGTRESGCQTEEVKIMPPSMRRIRAQKGHGIAAQMANFSNSSSGSIPTVSNSVGVIFAPQFSGGDQRFHSLPRQGVHGSRHTDPSYTSTPLRSENCTVGIVSCQVNNHSIHQENGKFQSNQTTYCASLIGKNLSNSSSEAVTAIAEPNSHAQHVQSVSSYPMGKPLSSAGHKEEQHLPSMTLTSTPSRYDSAVSLSTGTLTETDSQSSNLDDRKDSRCKNAQSESNYSYGSLQSCNSITQDQWLYDSPPKNSRMSNCSTPITHVCSGLECPSSKTESSLHYSLENDGDPTSMHLDLGLRSRSYSNINGTNHVQHSFYKCKEHHSQDDRISLYSNKSLSRSISLRKAKKPPLPPTRTDSLRRKPGKNQLPTDKNPQSNGSVLSKTLIASLQESLNLNLKSNEVSSPTQSHSSDYEDLWVQRSRSQSSISGGSGGMSPSDANINSIYPITPSQSDSSGLRTDSAEPMAYQVDRTRPQTEQHNYPDIQISSTDETPKDFSTEGFQFGSQMLLPPTPKNSLEVTAKSASSPDKMHQLASSNCGYSSQPNSSTIGNNLVCLKKTLSPAGLRPKPKVPERKSSLSSSVSVPPFPSLSSSISDPGKNSLHFTGLPSLLNFPTSLTPLTPPSPVIASRQNFTPLALPITLEKISKIIIPGFTFSPSEANPPPLPPPLPLHASITPPSLHESLIRQPVGTTLVKDALKSVEAGGTDNSLDEKKNMPDHSIEPDRFLKPVITAQALQMVQLRPVQKLERLSNADVGSSDLQKAKYKQQFPKPLTPEKPKNPETHIALPLSANYNFSINGIQKVSTPPPHSPIEAPGQACLQALHDDLLPSPSPLETLHSIPSKHKLPCSPQKPKLTLIVPPIFCQPAAEQGHPLSLDVNGTVALSSVNEESNLGTMDEQAFPQPRTEEDDKGGDLKSSPSLAGQEQSLSSGLSTTVSHRLLDLIIEDQELILCDERSTSEGDGDLRTCVARRSKRKVLGWRDSEEERRGSHSPSPPITPTGTSPGLGSLGSLPRQTGSIQRNLRKTATSSDNFKALLLKKGSRTESNFRMSAAEILRSTDPRHQRSHSDSALDPSIEAPISPCASPSQGRRAREQWARTEGVLPRFSPVFSASLAGTRHGRSRTPPSAASSRYGARSRILSSPMTVICEREGELSEAADAREPPESGTVGPPAAVLDSKQLLV
uniref:NHS like 1 n=1 Tax=Scleropages formosus TaxID=113540 RepID=A0A8C9S0S1_SCLFO